MNQENKAKLVKYAICFGVASLIALAVIWSKGFLVHSTAVNIQILSDAFFVSGALMSMFAGMLYISGEGALVGIGYVLRNAILTFIPMGRKKQERYADYRERKMSEAKKNNDRSILVTGLFFLLIGTVFTVIWYVKFYNV